MSMRTIQNRDGLQERIRVDNRIWDAIEDLQANTSPAAIQKVATAQARSVVVQEMTKTTGIIYVVENTGGEIVYDEDGLAKLVPVSISV